MNKNKTYLTTKEAAEYLGVDPRTILKRIERGEITAEKTGKSWRIQTSDLFNDSEQLRSQNKQFGMSSERFGTRKTAQRRNQPHD